MISIRRTGIRFSRVTDFCADVLCIIQTASALAEKSEKDLVFFIRDEGFNKVLMERMINVKVNLKEHSTLSLKKISGYFETNAI